MPGLDITPRPGVGKQIITSYGDGGFKISGKRFAGSVIIFPDRTVAWPVIEVGEVSLDALAEVTQATEAVGVLILGCGRQFIAPPPGLHQALLERGIALEWMDTGAACRTYNVLVLEARQVAAALLAVT